MTVETLKDGLGKLAPGGWSLTVNGYAKRAMKIKHDLSAREYGELRDLMHATGLPHRRVKFGGKMIDVWDFQK